MHFLVEANTLMLRLNFLLSSWIIVKRWNCKNPSFRSIFMAQINDLVELLNTLLYDDITVTVTIDKTTLSCIKNCFQIQKIHLSFYILSHNSSKKICNKRKTILNMFQFINFHNLFIPKSVKSMKLMFSMLNLSFLNQLLDIKKILFLTRSEQGLVMTRKCHFSLLITPSQSSFRVLDFLMKVHLQICMKYWNTNIVTKLDIWKISVSIFILLCIVESIYNVPQDVSYWRSLKIKR